MRGVRHCRTLLCTRHAGRRLCGSRVHGTYTVLEPRLPVDLLVSRGETRGSWLDACRLQYLIAARCSRCALDSVSKKAFAGDTVAEDGLAKVAVKFANFLVGSNSLQTGVETYPSTAPRELHEAQEGRKELASLAPRCAAARKPLARPRRSHS